MTLSACQVPTRTDNMYVPSSSSPSSHPLSQPGRSVSHESSEANHEMNGLNYQVFNLDNPSNRCSSKLGHDHHGSSMMNQLVDGVNNQPENNYDVFNGGSLAARRPSSGKQPMDMNSNLLRVSQIEGLVDVDKRELDRYLPAQVTSPQDAYYYGAYANYAACGDNILEQTLPPQNRHSAVLASSQHPMVHDTVASSFGHGVMSPTSDDVSASFSSSDAASSMETSPPSDSSPHAGVESSYLYDLDNSCMMVVTESRCGLQE